MHHGAVTFLPSELVEIFDQAYFLHLLATDPSKVIPPGKSLLSMMSRSQQAPESSTAKAREEAALRDRVEGVVHKAFWSEVHKLDNISQPNFANTID